MRNAVESFDDSPSIKPRIRVQIIDDHEVDFTAIEVIDNGRGIATEELAQVFVQGYSTKPQNSGLGLHKSALDAGQMGGRLEVVSIGPRCGTTARLILPCATSPCAVQSTGVI